MPRQLTIRNVPDEVGKRLESISRAQHQSLNATVVAILEKAVGVDPRRERLRRYTTWTEQDRDEFESVLREQRRIDEDLWR